MIKPRISAKQKYLRPAVIILILLTVPAAAATAMGNKDSAGGKVLTEEKTLEIETFMISAGSGNSGISLRPSSQAAWFLFQEVKASEGIVETAGNRKYGSAVQSQDESEIAGSMKMGTYRIKLEPDNPVSYRNPETIKVEFSLDDLILGSRLVMQPAQYAIVKAAGNYTGDQLLMRVIKIDFKKPGKFSAEVEAARKP